MFFFNIFARDHFVEVFLCAHEEVSIYRGSSIPHLVGNLWGSQC